MGNDYFLGEVKVPAGLVKNAKSVMSVNLPVSQQVPTGTYRLLFIADGAGVETESNEGNNTTFSGATLTVR